MADLLERSEHIVQERQEQFERAAQSEVLQPLWYKDAIIYELHVRAFYDSDADGIGDFRGLAQKLDYLQDLGVTAIWLLPFYPSPLKDDGYDIADYTDVHSAYGTLSDFRHFLGEAHRRGLKVITELVINHTSDQHPWFHRARRARPGSPEWNFYVWSDTPDRYPEARVIFQDFEHSNWTYDPVAKAYYWHRFYSHQPDLNFDNPAVQQSVMDVMDFWLQMGVDGLRLDAVPYLYEREGTNCENLPETHEFLKKLRRHVDRQYPNRMLLAEANQWPEDAVSYFGNGDECNTAFHFPLMPRMFMAVQLEDRYPILDILAQTPAIPENSQWCLFLRNHDELTLEMVTDEERDYMYRVYARDPRARINLGIRRRLAPLLGNDRKKVELMNGLLMSLPGTPIIYYGDEIGMGDNMYLGDRNGVRTPMQWSPDRNAGFSTGNPQRLFLPVIIDPENHYEVINVETRRNNTNSLFWWMKRLIALRKRFEALGRGAIEFLYPDNAKVLAFIRSFGRQRVLIVANLSRLAQFVELNLSPYQGMTPVELFGHIDFPRIGGLPYLLTLGPHAFYWFSIEQREGNVPEVRTTETPEQVSLMRAPDGWASLFERENKAAVEELLPAYLCRYRWFAGRTRKVKSAEIQEAIPLDFQEARTYMLILGVEYTEGDPETYALYLSFVTGDRAREVEQELATDIFARVQERDQEGLIYGALRERPVSAGLLDAIANRRRFAGNLGDWVSIPTAEFHAAAHDAGVLEATLIHSDQTHSSLQYGDRFTLKLIRRLETGVDPDLEVGLYLSDKGGFQNLPQVAGYIEYRRARGEQVTLGILHRFVANQGDGLEFTLDSLSRFFENAMTLRDKVREESRPTEHLLPLSEGELPQAASDTIGTYLGSAALLGQRTAEMHNALCCVFDDERFRPEPFTTLYQRSLYQTFRNESGRAMLLLRQRLKSLPEEARSLAERVLQRHDDILARFGQVLRSKIIAHRTRIHGNYHLGQVLWTGKDFFIVNFEGEPGRPISERRLRRSPLRDVAGMIRSFHYAAAIGLKRQIQSGVLTPDRHAVLADWARSWRLWVASAFLRSYLKTAADQPYIPQGRENLELMLDVYVLQKSIYELAYELNDRPDWVIIPLQGILQIMDH